MNASHQRTDFLKNCLIASYVKILISDRMLLDRLNLVNLPLNLVLEQEAICNPDRVVSSVIGNYKISLCFMTSAPFIPLFYKDVLHVAMALGRCFGGRHF